MRSLRPIPSPPQRRQPRDAPGLPSSVRRPAVLASLTTLVHAGWSPCRLSCCKEPAALAASPPSSRARRAALGLSPPWLAPTKLSSATSPPAPGPSSLASLLRRVLQEPSPPPLTKTSPSVPSWFPSASSHPSSRGRSHGRPLIRPFCIMLS
ncbi:hypothetical protein ZWY2020_025715 [Hordeum vulgare]|nr:hypothetical protein ZWY2020_025715 [Hordeum vulgare]